MKKWVAYLTISSIVLGSMPINVLAAEIPELLEKMEEVTEVTGTEEVKVAEEVIAPVSEAEIAPSEEVNKELPLEEVVTSTDSTENTESEELKNSEEKIAPRSVREFTLNIVGTQLGLVGGVHPGGGAFAVFNPDYIEMVDHDNGFGDYKGGFYYYDDAPNIGSPIMSAVVGLHEKEGDYHVALRAMRTISPGVINVLDDNGNLSYQILKTSSEVIVTGDDDIVVINGDGNVPLNPKALSVGRPSTDTYGDATFAWTITGPGGTTMSGTSNEELPTAADLTDTTKFPAGVYTLSNTVTETVPESSTFAGKVDPNTGQLLSTSATTSGSFEIAKKGDLIVNHYLNDQIVPFEVEETRTEIIGTVYTTKPTEAIPVGYELDTSKLPQETITYGETPTIVDYYYKKKETPVNIKYVYEDPAGIRTEFEGTAEVFIKQFEELFTANYKELTGYELVKIETSSGTIGEDGLTVTGTHQAVPVTVTYVYKKKKSDVVVKHVNMAGEPINDPAAQTITTNNDYLEPYKTAPAVIVGYTYKQMAPKSDLTNGTYGPENKEIIYMYEQNKTTLIVTHEATTGKILKPMKETPGFSQNAYATKDETFVGYTLVATPVNATGTLQDTPTTVAYLYAPNATDVKVNHLDSVTKKPLVIQVKVDGLFDEKYQTTPAEIPGYKLVVTPENAAGTFTMSTPGVTYEYEKIVPKLVVHFTDEKGNILSPAMPPTDGVWGEDYTTTPVEIEGYELVPTLPENAGGTFGDDDVTVTYVYQKKATDVTVNHLDTVTKEPISEQLVVGGLFGEGYQTTPAEIPGYKLVVTPKNATGKFTMTTPEVTYEYKKIVPKLTVHFTDEKGNILSSATPPTDGVWGEDYTTTPVEIKGYDLVLTLPLNANGTYGDDDVNVTYVYKKKPAKIIVKHKLENGQEFAPDTEKNGLFGNAYETKPISREGYLVIAVEGEAVGKYGETVKTITYVYTNILPPVVHITVEGSKVVTGIGIPNSDIKVTFPDGSVVDVHVGPDGKWQAAVPTTYYLKEGDSIKAVTVDKLTDIRSTVGIGQVTPLKVDSGKGNGSQGKTPGGIPISNKVSKQTTSGKGLPKTGEGSTVSSFLVGANLVLLAAGFYLFNRKKKGEN